MTLSQILFTHIFGVMYIYCSTIFSSSYSLLTTAKGAQLSTYTCQSWMFYSFLFEKPHTLTLKSPN